MARAHSPRSRNRCLAARVSAVGARMKLTGRDAPQREKQINGRTTSREPLLIYGRCEARKCLSRPAPIPLDRPVDRWEHDRFSRGTRIKPRDVGSKRGAGAGRYQRVTNPSSGAGVSTDAYLITGTHPNGLMRHGDISRARGFQILEAVDD